jgi:hypothetical protein
VHRTIQDIVDRVGSNHRPAKSSARPSNAGHGVPPQSAYGRSGNAPVGHRRALQKCGRRKKGRAETSGPFRLCPVTLINAGPRVRERTAGHSDAALTVRSQAVRNMTARVRRRRDSSDYSGKGY